MDSQYLGRLIFRKDQQYSETSRPPVPARTTGVSRMPLIHASRNTVVIGVQSIANVLLAFWLYMEYLHNPFMQEYVSNVWSTIGPSVIVGISATIMGGASLAFYIRKHPLSFTSESNPGEATDEVGNGGGLAPLDTCPFCNTPLKLLSEGRFQCRKCRRYFKK